jgi:hypothetical protein
MADQFKTADAMDVGTYGCFSLEPSPSHRLLSGTLLVGTYGHFKLLIGETLVCLPATLEAMVDYTLEVICP